MRLRVIWLTISALPQPWLEMKARLRVYGLHLFAGAACKIMGTEAPLQKPCEHRGSSAAWSGFGSRKMLFIP
jgi:hypothetical protein